MMMMIDVFDDLDDALDARVCVSVWLSWLIAYWNVCVRAFVVARLLDCPLAC